MGFAAAPPVASRSGGPRCQVAGCAAPLKGTARYNTRYRICEPHLRALSTDIAGVASRWCQTCSRWQKLSEFEGDKRTCFAYLEKLRLRRVAAKAAKAGPSAAAPACILFDHDALTAWLMAPPAAAAQAEGPSACKVDDDTFLAALLGLETPAPAAPATVSWLEHEQPVAHSFALKLPHAPPPDALPSAPLGAAMRAWAGEPLAMHAVAQPGCVLLTVDALSLYDAATEGHKRLQAADLTAAVHAACAGDADDAAAVRDAAAAVADGSSGGPCLLLRAAVLAPRAASLHVSLAAAPAGGALRARAHGSLLRCEAFEDADAGSWILNVSLSPPPEARPTLLLLDAEVASDATAPALSAPTPLLLCESAAVAAELDATLRSLPAADADAAAHLLGAAMYCGGKRAAPELLHAAACFAARQGCVATLETTLLPALLPLHACFRVDLLAAAAGAAQPAAVRLLLARGVFGDAASALHAAALAACSGDDDVAARGAAACGALTMHSAGAAAWFALRVRLGSNVDATPADVAARGTHPATIALCAALRTRRAAARKLIADAASAVASTTGPELRLAAMVQLLSGSGADAASCNAAADLAWHLVRHAAGADAMRRALSVERTTLCAVEFGGPPMVVSASFIALCMLRVMPLPALTPAQLASLATAGVQLTWLQYLRLECVPIMAAHAYGIADSAVAAALQRLAPLPLLRAAHERRHAARACGIAATQVFALWWSCAAGLHELPRVQAAAAAARLVVSLQALLIYRRLPPRYCAALCLMRAGVLLYAAAAPGCMLLPRSWLTRVTIAPHIAVFLLAAFRAVNTTAGGRAQGVPRRDKLE